MREGWGEKVKEGGEGWGRVGRVGKSLGGSVNESNARQHKITRDEKRQKQQKGEQRGEERGESEGGKKGRDEGGGGLDGSVKL